MLNLLMLLLIVFLVIGASVTVGISFSPILVVILALGYLLLKGK